MAKQINYWAILEPGLCYHVYNRAIGTELLFREPQNYDFFLTRFQHYFGAYVQLYAYCLMPNHFHLLLQFKTITPAVKAAMQSENNQAAQSYLIGEGNMRTFYEGQFRRIFTSYSRAYNKRYERTGSLFEAKFKRVVVKNATHFWDRVCYIHHNPIHHGFTADYESWPYHSYTAYLNKPLAWLKTKVALRRLATSPTAARTAFREMHAKYQLNFKKA